MDSEKFQHKQPVAFKGEIARKLRGKPATFHCYVETYDGSGVDCMVRFETPRGRRKLFCGRSAELVAVN